jgi:hypothetical protein
LSSIVKRVGKLDAATSNTCLMCAAVFFFTQILFVPDFLKRGHGLQLRSYAVSSPKAPNSSDALRWDRVRTGALKPISKLVFGDPNGLTQVEKNTNGRILREYIRANGKTLGFDMAEDGKDIEVLPSIRRSISVPMAGSMSTWSLRRCRRVPPHWMKTMLCWEHFPCAAE